MLAEDRPDRLQLGLVALGRRGRVGVDVLDVLRSEPGLLERAPGRADRAHAAGCRQRDVRRVGGRAVAHELGERRRAAGLRVLELLEHEDAGALADDEAIAARCRTGARPPAGSSFRVESARIAANPPISDLEDARLGAARQHDVGVVAADGLVRLADRVATGRAGRDRGEVGPGHAER